MKISEIRGEVVARTELGEDYVVVDTCYCNDTQKYETAVFKTSNMHVVVTEEYDNYDDAFEGHCNTVWMIGKVIRTAGDIYVVESCQTGHFEQL